MFEVDATHNSISHRISPYTSLPREPATNEAFLPNSSRLTTRIGSRLRSERVHFRFYLNLLCYLLLHTTWPIRARRTLLKNKSFWKFIKTSSSTIKHNQKMPNMLNIPNMPNMPNMFNMFNMPNMP